MTANRTTQTSAYFQVQSVLKLQWPNVQFFLPTHKPGIKVLV
mgnify:CR=1 FL=1